MIADEKLIERNRIYKFYSFFSFQVFIWEDSDFVVPERYANRLRKT